MNTKELKKYYRSLVLELDKLHAIERAPGDRQHAAETAQISRLLAFGWECSKLAFLSWEYKGEEIKKQKNFQRAFIELIEAIFALPETNGLSSEEDKKKRRRIYQMNKVFFTILDELKK